MAKKQTKSSRSGGSGGGGASSVPEEPPSNVSRPLKRAECAELLGVPADCKDEDVIKKAYRAAALKTHPDKGGSEEAFKKVNEAYTKMKAYANGEPAGEDNFDEDGGGVTEADYDDFVREMMFQMGGGMGGGMGGLGFMFSQMFGSSPPRKRRGFMPRKSSTKGKRMEEEEEEEEEDDDDDDEEEDVFEDDDDDIDFFDDIFGQSSGRGSGRPVFGGGKGTRRPKTSSSEAFFVPGVGFVEVSSSSSGSGGGGGGGGRGSGSGKGRRKTPKPGSAEYVKAFAEKNVPQEEPEEETHGGRTKKQVKTK